MSSQPSCKAFCVHACGPSLLNVSGRAGGVLHHEQPSISACRAGSHLTSAAIMPHQAGQPPALAAEQGARASLKIKCTVPGLHSQERGWLTPYWLRKFSGKHRKQQQPGQWSAVPARESPRNAARSGPGVGIMTAERGVNGVYGEGKSESLQHQMAFKQVTRGSTMRDNDAVTFFQVASFRKTLVSLIIYVFSQLQAHCTKWLFKNRRRIHNTQN